MKHLVLSLFGIFLALPAFAASNLYFDSGNGLVGIGTSSPSNSIDIANSGGIHLGSGTPASTTNALYASGSTLEWNGAPVGGSGYDTYADPNTILLLHMDGNANDSSIFGNTFTNNGVTFSSSVSKFGGYSAYFAGSSSANTYLTSASAPPISCTPNCTIDFWVQFAGNIPYIGSSTVYTEALVSSYTTAASSFSIEVTSGSTSGPPSLIKVNTGNYTPLSYSYSFALNTWYHIAVEIINSSAVYLWIDGTPEASSTTNVVPITAQPVSVGYLNSPGYYFPVLGYIDELRMSSAVRYQPGVAFTPPTAPYNPGPIQ
ncbi:MAG: LamG-like jellyroll fold domain-containing protein [Rhodomicrobium sp.]